MVRRVLAYMMELHALPPFTTDTAGVVLIEKNFATYFWRDRRSILGHRSPVALGGPPLPLYTTKNDVSGRDVRINVSLLFVI